jgi:hypothetical protein
VVFFYRTASVLVLVALSSVAAAGEDTRVYTNLDLERMFGPPSTDRGPVATHDDADWDFVTEFLDREHARIDADRSYEIERRRRSLEVDWKDRHHYHHYPYAGYPRGHVRTGRLDAQGQPGGHIVPLHARPSLALINYSRAKQRSGVDAFPARGVAQGQ